MNASPELQRYLDLVQRLQDWRRDHPEDTPEEDQLLDQMDDAWWAMSEEDRALANPGSESGSPR